MVDSILRWLTLTALCAAAFGAAAQSPPPPARSGDPLDVSARVPAVIYESALGRHRHAAEGKAIAWRDANDTVARIGGWRTYAREARQAEPAASVADAPTVKPETKAMPMPMPLGHGGHKMP